MYETMQDFRQMPVSSGLEWGKEEENFETIKIIILPSEG